MLTNIILLFFFFIAVTGIHELSHILTGRVFGVKMTWAKFHCVNFDPTGFSKLARWKKVLIIIVGPLSTLIIAGVLFLVGYSDYSLVALILFLFDAVPFQQSDIQNLRYFLRR